jgi:2-polyprenyl-3-methyl-5-hydroxy-6-metoxy-1,4-benzoquinol methylase
VKALSFERFDKEYQDVVEAVYRYWTPQMQVELASHNVGWDLGKFNFATYLRASSIRFYKAYSSFAEQGCRQTVCDVGGFWGVFPVTLKRLGYGVTMTESLQYYGDSFTALFRYIAEQGVAILDYDPFQSETLPPGRFDVVTLMAFLEHYPHSLKALLKNIISLINAGGSLYIEVQNIAFWPKRINLLLGRTPLVPLNQIFRSQVPFIGHHHEFTISELRELAHLSGLVVNKEVFYNYSPGALPGLRMLICNPLQFLSWLFLADSRECLAVLCRLKEDKRE